MTNPYDLMDHNKFRAVTGEEIKRVMNGEPPQAGDDEDGGEDEGNASVTAIPKAKPKKSPPEGGMEPEPTA